MNLRSTNEVNSDTRGRVDGAARSAPACLAFDLDGTLIDSRQDIACAVNAALAEVGLAQRTTDEITTFIGDGPRKLLARASGRSVGDPLLPALLAHYHDFYERHPARFSKFMPGVSELFTSLPGPFAVCTNKTQTSATRVLESMGLLGWFRIVIGLGETDFLKPAPACLQRVAEFLAIPVTDVWFVGDSPQDIECGRRAGATTVAVSNGLHGADALLRHQPTHLIDTLHALPSLLC